MGNSWVTRQRRDGYVNAARRRGFRARSVFKLAELDRKYGLLAADSRVLDLGAAPGSWSQYAATAIGGGGRDRVGRGAGRIVAVDLRPMQPLDKVRSIRGDCTDASVLRAAIDALDGRADLVLSDMAPNMSGIRVRDQARAEDLQRAVLECCRLSLRAGGAMLTKVFAGESMESIRALFAPHFARLREVKPAASRGESRELYILARDFRGPPPNALP